MKIERVKYPGWNEHPCYQVKTFQDYLQILSWMKHNQVENFQLSSGAHGYTFQVKTNHDWFLLRWT
jgi:hypothetical protein